MTRLTEPLIDDLEDEDEEDGDDFFTQINEVAPIGTKTFTRTIIGNTEGGDQGEENKEAQTTNQVIVVGEETGENRKGKGGKKKQGKRKSVRFFTGLKNLLIGTSPIGRRRRVGLFCLLSAIVVVCIGSQVDLGSIRSSLRPIKPTVVTLPGGSTGVGSTPLPAGMLSNFASTQSHSNADNARDTAKSFSQGLWTYDFAYPNEYVDRLLPYIDKTLVDQIRSMSTDPQSLQQELVQRGFIRTIDLTIGSDGTTAQAVVQLDVSVLHKASTVPITGSGQPITTTVTSSTPNPNSRTSYENFTAPSTLNLNLHIEDHSWYVVSYSLSVK